jgi:hypothetical protein
MYRKVTKGLVPTHPRLGTDQIIPEQIAWWFVAHLDIKQPLRRLLEVENISPSPEYYPLVI